MIYGLYLSAQGAQIQTLRQDVLANNLANASTNSFKRDLVRAQAHLPYDAEHAKPTWVPGNLADMPGGVTPYDVVTDYAQGALTPTNGAFDFALTGKGFFRVGDGKKTFLTRDGQFAINAQSQLVMRDTGLRVLAANGTPIGPLDPSLPMQILPDGSVIQGGDELGKLALVEPTAYGGLQKVGNNLYSSSVKLVPAKPETEIKAGHIENSGVNPVAGMVEMIDSSRVLESNVNMIKTQDESLGRLLDSLQRR